MTKQEEILIIRTPEQEKAHDSYLASLKREEIREGIRLILSDYKPEESMPDYAALGDGHRIGQNRFRIVDAILRYLHSQGVVIKVERELPYYCVCENEFEAVTMPEPSKNDFSHSNGCHLYNQGLKASYVAVEPLIKSTKE